MIAAMSAALVGVAEYLEGRARDAWAAHRAPRVCLWGGRPQDVQLDLKLEAARWASYRRRGEVDRQIAATVRALVVGMRGVEEAVAALGRAFAPTARAVEAMAEAQAVAMNAERERVRALVEGSLTVNLRSRYGR